VSLSTHDRDAAGLGRRLAAAEFGGDDRLPARLGVFREVVFHTGLNTAAAGLNTRAGFLDIRLAGFDDGDIAEKSLLAWLGKLGEVLLDARPQPAAAGLNSGAVLLELGPTGLANDCLLRHSTG